MMEPIKELDAKGLREFALVVGGTVAVLFGIVLPWLFGFGFPRWPWVVTAKLASGSSAASEYT